MSAEEARAYVVEYGLVTEAEAAAYSDGATDVLRFAVLQGTVTTQEQVTVLDDAAYALQDADIEINPRIGTWDRENLAIVALDTPWLTTSR